MGSAPLAVIVLAAGEGTRMRSRTPKVLHGFAGRSLLGHVLAAAEPLGAAHTVVVVGHGRDAVTEHLGDIAPSATAAVQDEQHGTGHAVRVALEHIPSDADGTVVVLLGDTPLLRSETLARLIAVHDASDAAATLLSSVAADPTGYGRVIRGDGDEVVRVVEQADATPAELARTEIASGVYAFDAARLRAAIGRIDGATAQGEEYLPDVIPVLRGDGHRVAVSVAPLLETAGVNDRVQLAAAHRAYNLRLLEDHMRAGVTVVDPATTWVDSDVTLEPDVTLLPGTDLRGATHVAAGAVVGPYTSLHDTTVGADARVERTVAMSARIGAGATVGPFAYLRPGAELGDGAHVGTYVEIKNSAIGPGTKVPHLTYVGDATIGAGSNIGAATVFVNYDGVEKHRSTVGDQVRIGSDTMIVAPVTIGDGAYTAAGSVITQDVPAGAMAVARAKQRNVKGWVARRRAGTAADLAAQQAAPEAPEEGES